MYLKRAILTLLAAILLPGLAMAQTQTRATFVVEKDFDDLNEASTQVYISCNTGLPLEQTKVIDIDNPVEFVVTDFDDGTLDCHVWETPVLGYSIDYDAESCDSECYAVNEGDEDDDDDDSEWGCYFEGYGDGDSGMCDVDNQLDEVKVEVTKVWFDDEPDFNNSLYAHASWGCDNVADIAPDDDDSQGYNYCSYDECGSQHFYGKTDTSSFYVLPDWDTGTECDVNERTYDSGVETDDSDCQSLILWPGIGAECTIENTRFYEGIPTLNQYGMAIMALLMLGLGFVGFRRFV